MRQSFFVTGKLPGANQCLWKHWRTFQRTKLQAQSFIGYAIRKAKIQKMEYAVVSFEWREPDQKRDIDNIMFAQKFILDSLVKQKILKDDGWAQIQSITHRVVLDALNPGVLVTLEEER